MINFLYIFIYKILGFKLCDFNIKMYIISFDEIFN